MNSSRSHLELSPKRGTPGWVVTFADMILLLMAFFILMFAFSEVDKAKYVDVVSSMHNTFGGKVKKGESGPVKIIEKEKIVYVQKDNPLASSTITVKGGTGGDERQTKLIAQTATDVVKLKDALKEEIDSKQIEIEQRGQIIILKLLGDHAFESGSPELLPSTEFTLRCLANELKKIKGTIVVSGYTDNIPLKSSTYRSNWELSAARAFSVIDEFINMGISPERLTLRGFGETRSIVKNDTPEHRAINRRVEITIDQRPVPVEVTVKKNAVSYESEVRLPWSLDAHSSKELKALIDVILWTNN